jgi:predicted transcriptional regulator
MMPAQCRAARGLIGITQTELARLAVVPRNVLIDFEVSLLPPKPAHLEAIRRAFEAAGVEFTNGGQPGVRLRGPGGTIAADQLNAGNDE